MKSDTDILKERYGHLTYWEVEMKWRQGEINLLEKMVLQKETPDYMAMAEDIEVELGEIHE